MLSPLRSLLFALALLLSTTTPTFAELTQLADKVYAYVGATDASAAASFAANAGIIIGRDGVLVVDTLVSAKEGERFLTDIRKVTDKPIKYVVNTHTHLDHTFGNCVFARLGATIIAQQADHDMLAETGAEALKNAANFGLTSEQMEGTEIVLPSLTFSERMSIELGDATVELIRTAPSHTAGSAVVYVPAIKLLFAGDILFTDFHPYLADGDLAGWTQTLDALLAMDVEKIVPGHGPLSDKQDLREMKAYLAQFDAKAQALAANGLDADAIAVELLKKLPQRSLAAWMVAFNLKSRYLPQP